MAVPNPTRTGKEKKDENERVKVEERKGRKRIEEWESTGGEGRLMQIKGRKGKIREKIRKWKRLTSV